MIQLLMKYFDSKKKTFYICVVIKKNYYESY